MKSLRGVGVGLSVVFGCLLLALLAEFYYLLWWKKRVLNRDLELGYNNHHRHHHRHDNYIALRDFFCWKKLPSFRSTTITQVHEPQAHQINSNSGQFWHKPFGGGEDNRETEILGLQNIAGPPRFLFTIKEETKEDLESDDGKYGGDRSRKGSRGKSLSDFFHILETPYLTPIGSPSYFTPPLTPVKCNHGFGSVFGSASEAEFNCLVRSSPPPKFQFLKDAEEKLLHRNNLSRDAGFGRDQESVVRMLSSSTSVFLKDNENDAIHPISATHFTECN